MKNNFCYSNKTVYKVNELLKIFSNPISGADLESFKKISRSIKYHNLDIVAMDLLRNNSYQTKISGNTIYLGLQFIERIHCGIAQIIEDFTESYLCKSIFDLVQIDWPLEPDDLRGLVESGAMDSFEGNRAQNYMAIDLALEYRDKLYVSKKYGEEYNLRILDKPKLTYYPEWPFREKTMRERSVLGFSVVELMMGTFIYP